MSGTTDDKVVTVIDLSRYSDICGELEQQLDANAVAAVNRQVKTLARQALADVGLDWNRVYYRSTGDGAIVVLDSAAQAARFAEQVHLAAREHNRGKTLPRAQRHFRVGVWRGQLALLKEHADDGRTIEFDFAGASIAYAVRLESARKTGEVLISAETYASLDPEEREKYGPEEVVRGKRDEVFRAHRRRVVEPAPWEVPGYASGAQKRVEPGRVRRPRKRARRKPNRVGLIVGGALAAVALLVLAAGATVAFAGRSLGKLVTAPSTVASATRTGPAYLSDLRPLDASTWISKPPAPPDRPPPPSDVRVDGRVSPHGLFMHPPLGPDGGPTRLTYRLGGQFATFRADVSLNDGPEESETPLTFAVYGDGRLLWRSKAVTSQADAQACEVSVKGVDVLTIQVDCPGPARGAHAVWLEPRVE